MGGEQSKLIQLEENLMECTIKNIVDTSVSLAMLRLNLKWIIGGLTASGNLYIINHLLESWWEWKTRGNKWYYNRFVKTQHKQ